MGSGLWALQGRPTPFLGPLEPLEPTLMHERASSLSSYSSICTAPHSPECRRASAYAWEHQEPCMAHVRLRATSAAPDPGVREHPVENELSLCHNLPFSHHALQFSVTPLLTGTCISP